MEVEFTYRVTGIEGWDALQASGTRAAELNKNISYFNVGRADTDDGGYVVIRSGGHDQSAIVRRIVSPIRAIFHRAKIDTARIQLIGQRIMPTGRSLTHEEGRTPKGTFATESLVDMLADAAKVEKVP